MDEVSSGMQTLAEHIAGSKQDEMFRHISIDEMRKSMFVCCFSIGNDLLPMWNYYTKEPNGQGYNIKFNKHDLVRSILKNNECLDGCDIAFGSIDYGGGSDPKYMAKYSEGVALLVRQTLFGITECFADDMDANTLEDERKELEANIAKYHFILESRDHIVDVVVEECRQLIKDGYKEINPDEYEGLVSGIEFDCWYRGIFLHLLCYGADINSEKLKPFLAKNKAETEKDIIRIFALRNVPKLIQAIHEAGGIAVLAHSACCWTINHEHFVKCMKNIGLDGLEVFYPYKRHRGIIKFHKVKTVKKIAEKLNMLKTGGSDTHKNLI